MPTWICDGYHVKDRSHVKQTKTLITIDEMVLIRASLVTSICCVMDGMWVQAFDVDVYA